NGNPAVGVHGDARAVVAPIFEPVQSFDQQIGHRTMAHISDDSTHNGGAPERKSVRGRSERAVRGNSRKSSKTRQCGSRRDEEAERSTAEFQSFPNPAHRKTVLE